MRSFDISPRRQQKSDEQNARTFEEKYLPAQGLIIFVTLQESNEFATMFFLASEQGDRHVLSYIINCITPLITPTISVVSLRGWGDFWARLTSKLLGTVPLISIPAQLSETVGSEVVLRPTKMEMTRMTILIAQRQLIRSPPIMKGLTPSELTERIVIFVTQA